MTETATAITNRAGAANSALLVIDLQVEVVAVAHDRDKIVGTIGGLVDRARAGGAPVIWIQHADDDLPNGTDGWQIVPELVPDPDEVIIHKNFRNSFEATELTAELDRLQVGRLIITGSQSDFCVRWTLHGALERGFDTVLVADGHTTDATPANGLPDGMAMINHTNTTWASQASGTGITEVKPASAITF